MDSDKLPALRRSASIERGDRVDLLQTYLLRFEREQTRRNYRNDIVQFFGTDDITIDHARAITFVDVNQHLADLEAEQYKPSSIKRRIAALRGFFEWLQAIEAITRNPTERQLLRKVRTTSAKMRKIVFLSAEQARRLVDAVTDNGDAAPRDRALMLTMLHCVLRRSEAAAMDVDHVRPLGRYWVVDLPDTKGGADQYVKIPDHVVAEIDAMRRHYGITSGPLWRSFSNNSYMNRLSARSIYSIVRNAAVRAGIDEHVGAHTLRHTGCTLAIESGATVQQVQTHARHRNIETTMAYVHQRDRLRDSAADFINIDRDEPSDDVK